MKWIIGSFMHETNTFSTVPTDIDAFRAQMYLTGDDIAPAHRNTETLVGGFMDIIEARDDEAIYTVSSHATPSGLVTIEAYETMTGHILLGIRNHPDADCILLGLHGAMTYFHTSPKN